MDEGLQMIASALVDNTGLTELNLTDNKIMDEARPEDGLSSLLMLMGGGVLLSLLSVFFSQQRVLYASRTPLYWYAT